MAGGDSQAGRGQRGLALTPEKTRGDGTTGRDDCPAFMSGDQPLSR